MYAFVGYCTRKIFDLSAPFAFQTLTFAHHPGVQKLQSDLIRFCSEKVFRLPAREGFVLYSGSEANEVAFLIAKRENKRKVVIASNLEHSSVENSCAKLDLDLKIVDVDAKTFQSDPQLLVKKLREQPTGRAILSVTYGTTQLGTVENCILAPEVKKVLREKNVWLHIDAAYGGFILGMAHKIPRGWSEIFALAHSITVDPHKFVGIWGCSVLLLKKKSYKQLIGPEVPFFGASNTALGTTRSAFPAATAMNTIRQLNYDGLHALALDCYKKAEYITAQLKKNHIPLLILELVTPNIPLWMPSKQTRDRVEEELYKKGFLVSPIQIIGKKYHVWGLRVAVTPRDGASWKNIKEFTSVLIRTYKRYV
jgi:glutamate/tyrosine decarboxylase-like PLP-dependent enzyme